MSIEDKIADLLKESEALQMAEACKTKMKEQDSEDETSTEDDVEDEKENKMKKEDIDGLDEEQLDELSKKTLGSYVKKAADKMRSAEYYSGLNDSSSAGSGTSEKTKQRFRDTASKRSKGINTAVNKLTKEDIDADVDALMNGENLTEEFREKATAIFEAAVMSRVTQEVETLEEEFQERLVEYYEGAKEEIVEKVDGYLNYVVEQWMNDNELAVTTGIKNDILEGFVSGMKNLFQEHYIEVPDEKLDLVAELQESVAKLESKLDESLESNVTMSKYINYVERNTITEEFCKSMTDTEVEKFKSLVEELSFEDTDTYSSKLQIIKENYFGKKSTAGKVGSIVTDSPVQLTESVQNIDPNVAQYLETFNRIKI